MKLLLTSAGIRNQSIADALAALVGKPAAEVKIGFVPTAANVEGGNKDWFIAQLQRLQAEGYGWIDLVDVSAPGTDWKTRLALVDVIFVSGGNTYHLLDQVRKTGFGKWLEANLAGKVYVGVSAGTILVTPSIAIAGTDNGDPNLPGLTDFSGLNLVGFEISPHTPEMVSAATNEAYRKTSPHPLYAIDDETAIAVTGGQVRVVSEGAWARL